MPPIRETRFFGGYPRSQVYGVRGATFNRDCRKSGRCAATIQSGLLSSGARLCFANRELLWRRRGCSSRGLPKRTSRRVSTPQTRVSASREACLQRVRGEG
jgi:hypothetical protein